MIAGLEPWTSQTLGRRANHSTKSNFKYASPSIQKIKHARFAMEGKLALSRQYTSTQNIIFAS